MRVLALAPPSFAPLALLPETVATTDVAADADVILVGPRYGHLLQEIWPEAKRVRWVHVLSAGVEPVLFDALRDSGVPLTNGRGVFADALGEFALAAMLWFAKGLGRMRRNQAAHQWEPFNVQRLEGRTVGIVGYGSIGRAVGGRAEAMGMRVVAMSRTAGDLDTVLAASDYLVISAPLTPQTRHLITATHLAQMKPDAVLINIGRGPIVDEAALIEALRTNRIRGAALDVFETEPLPPTHPFWTLDNVLLSPHCADHTPDSHERAMRLFLTNLARFERGEPLENIVDQRQGY